MLVFRLAGSAQRSFASAANTVVSLKRYELITYGDRVNWLLKKDSTHAAFATAYHDIITMVQLDTQVPRLFATRVEAACDRLCGLFHTQDVKNAIINGLDDLIQPDVHVLDIQFPDCPLVKTVAAAQGIWEGADRLRLSINVSRPPLIKVGQIDRAPMPSRSAARPYEPTNAIQVQPPARATNACYYCNDPGHYAPHPPKPRRERRQAHDIALIQHEIRKQVNAITDSEVLKDSSGDETCGSEAPDNDVDHLRKGGSREPAGACPERTKPAELKVTRILSKAHR